MQLIFEFPEEKGTSANVHFALDIGPIDLGFAKIEQVAMEYKTKGADKGLRLSLIGSFFWSSGQIQQDENGTQKLEWDPSRPQDAPSPPGGGNKYLDLRLLAMGHHIRLQGAGEFHAVQEAVDALKVLHAPEDEKLPAGPGGQLEFSASAGWLIAADLGVLRITEEKEQPARYFLGIAGIFNDPALYGIHVRLDGEEAKVLKGLEFDIMYRQISDQLGCYSSHISLPEIMRKLQLGVFSITMPSFYLEIYTNGDFLVDVGFPHSQDFTNSFALEAVVPPGIPVTGAAGFYFGKLSSETTSLVPKASNGRFSPVTAFGLGIRMGVGKSIDAGPLKAGFSITVFGIIEGVIARWLPYAGQGGTDPAQIQDTYYFRLQGSVGVIGNLYGSVDLSIIKASVSILVGLEAAVDYASYEPVPITVMALVDVRLTLQLDLWLFTIKIHLSFSLQVKETFVIENHGEAPWRLDTVPARTMERLFGAPLGYHPCFANLKPAQSKALSLILAPAMSVAGDGAKSPSDQKMCFVPLFFIRSAPPVYGEDPAALLKETAGRKRNSTDDFALLAERLVLWLIAAGIGPMGEQEAGAQIVSEAYLKGIEGYLADPKTLLPFTPEDITAFLMENFTLDISLPPEDAKEELSAVVFPAIPQLTLRAGEAEAYCFASYHMVDSGYLAYLKQYFSSLAVAVEEEEQAKDRSFEECRYSVCSYVFADYFLMLAKQLIRSMLDGLRSFFYVPQPGSSVEEILADIRKESAAAYDAADLFDANGDKMLQAGKTLTFAGQTYVTAKGDTLRGIAQAYGQTPRIFAEHADNLRIKELFSYTDDPCLSVPHLSAYRVSGLLEEAERTLALQKTGAMVSRYMLHGLRLPTDAFQSGEDEKTDGAGLYAVMGQQILVPDDIQEGTFRFSLGKNDLNQITFGHSEQKELTFVLEGKNYQNLCTVRDHVKAHRFRQDIRRMQAKDPSVLRTLDFSAGEMAVWNAFSQIRLPHGSGDGKQLRSWELPKDLCALLRTGDSAVLPAVYPVKSRFDEAEGKCLETPADNYGLGARITVMLKKLADENCYEITGAKGKDALLLERIVCSISDLQAPDEIGEIALLYKKDGADAYESGSDHIMLGISKTDLSTVTRPDLMAGRIEDTDGQLLLNSKKQFFQFLWEASITRRGGFYLHYYDPGTEGALPDTIFNDRGEGEVCILLLSPASGDRYEQVRYYHNILVTDVPVQEEHMVLKTYVREMAHKAGKEDSLDSLAETYYGEAGAIASDNRDAYPAAGTTVLIQNGAYCTGTADPGTWPDRIAEWFGITRQALLQKNPEWKDWSGPLPLYTALKLPDIRFTVSAEEKRNMEQIADHFGISMEQFADSNRNVQGLFAPDSQLRIKTGPWKRHAVRPAGSAGLRIECAVPKERTEENYAESFLRSQFQMLGYAIAQNSGFAESPQGIPAGPAAGCAKAEGLKSGRLRAAGPLQAGETWQYDIEVSYGNYKVEDKTDSGSYGGLHRILQLDLHWQDIFGNRIYSDLDDPGDGTVWNRRPQFTGYADQLYGISSWPYTGAAYSIDGQAAFCVRLTFDKDRPKAAGGDSREVKNAYRAYCSILEQLTDPNGIVLSVRSTLISGKENLLNAEHCDKIREWVSQILDHLKGLLEGEIRSVPEDLELRMEFEMQDLEPKDIFAWKVWFGIYRDRSLVMPGMGLTEEVWKAETELLPDMDPKNGGSEAFAQRFYHAFYDTAGIHMEVAHGADRLEGDSGNDRLWVVRFGNDRADGIRIYGNGRDPVCYAPAPLCTHLVSLEKVPVYDYRVEQGIDFGKPSRQIDVMDIDADEWLKSVLENLDETLSPAFCLAVRLIDDRYGTGHLEKLLTAKKKLAQGLKTRVLPVLEDEHPDEREIKAIQETCYQQLLEQLKSYYDMCVLLQVPLQVDTALQEAVPPRAFGSLIPTDGKTDLTFTSPKLDLLQSSTSRPALLHTVVKGGASGSQTHQNVAAVYDIRCFEHQIDGDTGIDGYQKSSWLHFIRDSKDQDWPLRIKLPAADLPFVLRSYPVLPALIQQGAVAAKEPYTQELFEKACLWDYHFTYQGELFVQDTVYAKISFNVKESVSDAPGPALLESLAQFVTVYPQMQETLETTLLSIHGPETDEDLMETAQKAVRGYVEMAEKIADHAGETGTVQRMTRQEEEVCFSIRQREIGGIYEIALEMDPGEEGSTPVELHIKPEIDGWETEAQEAQMTYRFKKDDHYLTAAEAVTIQAREIVLMDLHIGQYQSAKAAIWLKRNGSLIEGRATAQPFVYQTPEACFHDSAVPQLVCGQPVSIAQTGGVYEKRTLEQHLWKLLEQVKKGSSNIKIQLCIHYSYLANASLGARVRLPAVLVTTEEEAISVLAQKTARICQRRINESMPEGKHAKLEMEITVVSLLTKEPVAVMRFTEVYLDVEDILLPGYARECQ